MYKYMTWTEGKYFEGNYLLGREQITSLLNTFVGKKLEQFVTIQDYDAEDNIIGCPLYFDIDAASLIDAYEEMHDLVDQIKEEYDVEPHVWFSGGKGFHVIAPIYIRHERCHEIAKMIWQEKFTSVECDPAVYRTRAMFRVSNTWNIKGDRFKIPVDYNDELHKMIQDAEIMRININQAEWKTYDLELTDYIDRLPTFSDKIASGEISFDGMMPCLKNIWAMDVPPVGSRHEIAYMFVKHCHQAGIDEHDAEAMFSSHPFWSTVNERDYQKIITSVYRAGSAMIGCKNNELLQSNCVKFCRYNTGMSISATLRG